MNIGNVEEDTKRGPLAEFVVVSSPIAAVYGIIFMKLRLTVFINLGLLFLSWILPAIVIAIILSSEEYDFLPIVILSYIPAVHSFFTILRVIKESISNNLRHYIGSLVSIFLCVVVPLVICTAVLYVLLKSEEIDVE